MSPGSPNQKGRRASVSDKLWANNFLDNPVAPVVEVDADDGDETFVSAGIQDHRGELDGDETVNSRGEREPRVGVAALRRKVDNSRRRHEASKESWESKVREECAPYYRMSNMDPVDSFPQSCIGRREEIPF